MKKINIVSESEILNIIDSLKTKHKDVYWIHIEGQIYIYKPLGRRDYKEVVEMDVSDLDKEDEIIKKSLLYPENLDIDNVNAGVIKNLFNVIIENSFLDSIETRANVLGYFRNEMFDMANQITCIINEAFPQYDIEDIENWGIERTAKYLSRAEWKLQNLRGLSIDESYINQIQNEINQNNATPNSSSNNINTNKETINNSSNVYNNPNKPKELTPEYIAEMKRKFPEFDWDNVVTDPNDMHYSVDTTPAALRPGI